MVAVRPFWSLHTHSKFSVNDALPEVSAIVRKAVEYDYPAIGLTDHRGVSGSIQLYAAARKAGIEPLPGIELDVVPEMAIAERTSAMHLTVAAYSEQGYRNLCHLATQTAKRFWYKPLIDFADLAQMAEDGATRGLVVSTGCYFGVLPKVLRNQGPAAAEQVVKALAGWFPKVYVELQNHGIDEHHDEDDVTDDEMMEGVWQVAQRVGLPVIIGRDSHYIDEADKPLHDGLKRLVSWSDDADDAVFPGGGYHMTDTAGLKEYFPPTLLQAGLEGLSDLANAAYVRLPEMENFSLKIPDVTIGTEDPQEILEKKVMAALTAEERERPEVMSWLRKEFDVVRTTGMAPYMLLCDRVCEFMRSRPRPIRYWVRGSASGSYILFKLKVSQIDPIRFGLRADRFLSLNRMKPPDVDFDVEHGRRDEVIAFLRTLGAVRSVGSHMKYSLFEQDEGDDSGGSLRVRYYSTLTKQGKGHPLWRDIPRADKDLLMNLGGRKLISGYGTHAAGYIVAPTEEVVRELPLAYIASSKKFVTAYGKKDVEKLGYLKLDLLGLRTATAIDYMCEEAGVDWDAIPEGDMDVFTMIGKGQVDGVFQLDGYAMRKGCEQIRPKRLEDIIAAQALFRPAPMTSGMTTDWRARRSRREPVPTRHKDIMEATKETYGVLLYQEQVMDVMEILGMDQLELESMLDAVKASNEYSEGAAVVLEELMPRIRELAGDRGWSDVDIEWLAEGLVGFSEYSFNKAHAGSYGTVAYRSAWMKYHHPLEFWCGMLVAYADASKPTGKPHPTVKYAQAARRDGVKIRAAHVNHSDVVFKIDRSGREATIRKGLTTVKGVGVSSAQELVKHQPYTSLRDIGEKVIARKVTGAKHLALGKSPVESGGIIAHLADADALDGLE